MNRRYDEQPLVLRTNKASSPAGRAGTDRFRCVAVLGATQMGFAACGPWRPQLDAAVPQWMGSPVSGTPALPSSVVLAIECNHESFATFYRFSVT